MQIKFLRLLIKNTKASVRFYVGINQISDAAEMKQKKIAELKCAIVC